MTHYSISPDDNGDPTLWVHPPYTEDHPLPLDRKHEVSSLTWKLIEEAISSGRLPSSDRPAVGNLVMYRQEDYAHYGVAIVRDVDWGYRRPLEVQWYDTGEITRENPRDMKVVEQ